ncbi:phosphate acyltransferase PlsX [Selenomonas sp. TAMA-11512]|uniref:phosphate acyltransferase PlsX n=1 Tax=Selenomonas sp. TAMA-11512 TaxID=3095337 RepID=UPI003089047A|nr:phosphate acyltransferase PlsX [Selenomonas sp. TAMA-11512]
MKIAIDAMGGDHAPLEIVKGAVMAAEMYDAEIVLVGDEPQIRKILADTAKWESLPISIRHTTEIIEMTESAEAVRIKKDSSLVVATQMIREGTADAVLSAGSTAGAVAAAQLYLKRMKGIHRPTIATPMPTPQGTTLLLDSGANVDSKPEWLVQSAIMGSIYAENVLHIDSPKVGLLNIGEEEEKGNQLVKETYPLMQACSAVSFVGNVEGRDIPKGDVDVVVCDGFVGNVILKFGEGLAKTIIGLLKDAVREGGIMAKLGAFLLIPTLKKLAKKLDVDENGGAPLLGVNGCVLIAHGSSNAKSICSAIRIAKEYVDSDVVSRIKESIQAENQTGEVLPEDDKQET